MDQPATQLLTRAEVVERTGISQAHIYRMLERGTFPKPLALGRLRSDGNPVSIAWNSAAIDEWMKTREVKTPEGFAAPSGAHIAGPVFNRPGDAAAFAAGMVAYGPKVHAADVRRFAVWFPSRGEARDLRTLEVLRRNAPGFPFSLVSG